MYYTQLYKRANMRKIATDAQIYETALLMKQAAIPSLAKAVWKGTGAGNLPGLLRRAGAGIKRGYNATKDFIKQRTGTGLKAAKNFVKQRYDIGKQTYLDALRELAEQAFNKYNKDVLGKMRVNKKRKSPNLNTLSPVGLMGEGAKRLYYKGIGSIEDVLAGPQAAAELRRLQRYADAGSQGAAAKLEKMRTKFDSGRYNHDLARWALINGSLIGGTAAGGLGAGAYLGDEIYNG